MPGSRGPRSRRPTRPRPRGCCCGTAGRRSRPGTRPCRPGTAGRCRRRCARARRTRGGCVRGADDDGGRDDGAGAALPPAGERAQVVQLHDGRVPLDAGLLPPHDPVSGR
ncbi:unnamed protein product, partial [Plutella xylostella]